MRKWWFSTHKWVGLVVALQMLAWVASGLFMTYFPIEQVRSEHNIAKPAPRNLRAEVGLISAQNAIAAVSAPISRIELVDIAGRWMWRIDSNGKPHTLIDAQAGKVISPLNEANARRIAAADFAGAGKIKSALRIEKEAPIEFRGALPAWQIVFGDADETHLYVDALTGRVSARRSALWRAYDFLWGLHIMDWTARENFNHWPIVIMSVLALVTAITGIGLLVIRFWPRLSPTVNSPTE